METGHQRGRRVLMRLSRLARLATVFALALLAASPWSEAGQRLAGHVLKVDVESSSLTIIDAGKKYTLWMTPETVIRQGPDDRALADLKRGDRIVITLVDGTPDQAEKIAIAGSGRIGNAATTSVPGFAPGLNARNVPVTPR
jgi:hypothetical protein